MREDDKEDLSSASGRTTGAVALVLHDGCMLSLRLSSREIKS